MIARHEVLQHFYHNEWVHLVALDPEDRVWYRYRPMGAWHPIVTLERRPFERVCENRSGKEPTDEFDLASDEGNSCDRRGGTPAFVTDLLDRVKATGYTIIGNISGKGHHGVREAHFMFSEQESLEIIMTVVPEEKVEPILAGLRPLFERHSGSCSSPMSPSADRNIWKERP